MGNKEFCRGRHVASGHRSECLGARPGPAPGLSQAKHPSVQDSSTSTPFQSKNLQPKLALHSNIS